MKEELIRAAQEVLGEFALSRSDLSAGSVASALLTAGGNIYTGICVHLSCGIGVCAEHAAVCEMLKHRETQIRMIVAVSSDGVLPPCGRCRELLLQIDRRNAETIVLLGGEKTLKLKELMPEHWMNLDMR